MTRFTFTKSERLKSLKIIGELFRTGQSFGVYPLRFIWLKTEEAADKYPVQFTVSVGKRNFKSAVRRNRIKRKVREAWRLNKHLVYQKVGDQDAQFAVMVLYTAKEELPFEDIYSAMQISIKRFIKKNRPAGTNSPPSNKPLS